MENQSKHEGKKYDHSYIGVWRAVKEIETGRRPSLEEGFVAFDKACKESGDQS